MRPVPALTLHASKSAAASVRRLRQGAVDWFRATRERSALRGTRIEGGLSIEVEIDMRCSSRVACSGGNGRSAVGTSELRGVRSGGSARSRSPADEARDGQRGPVGGRRDGVGRAARGGGSAKGATSGAA